MNLVFFEDAIDHVIRIARILRQPRGSMMFIGVGGSGKQSLTRLCSHMLGCLCSQVELSKNFGTKDFREFMKNSLLYPTGIDGEKVVFLMTDT
jgi:dynein heavy chain